MPVVRLIVVAGALPLLLSACGGGSSTATPPVPTIQAARTFELAGFTPTGPVAPGKAVTVSFVIRQPSGRSLTAYRRGSGPHTGIHLIIVRSDLAVIIHRHPPVAVDGRVSEPIVFPAPGRYRVVVDAYPQTSGPMRNFQLFDWITVNGHVAPQPLPPLRTSEIVDGYRFRLLGGKPRLHAIQASFMKISVTDPRGRPTRFTPWYGALAHAIFFRKGSLDYFHTHVCAPGASGCTSVLGATSVTGSSATPGELTVGVLVPLAGTWRLFLQCRVKGKVLTAPFTLRVAA